MAEFTPTDLRPLFPPERAELLAVLRSLTQKEWQLPTVCAGWSIHDVALHLLNGDLRFIAGHRDGYQSPHRPVVQPPFGRAEVTALVDEINNRWIDGARWMSPEQVIDQLERSGIEYFDTMSTFDMDVFGIPVDWIQPGPAPVWMDVAREYTERWIHQQQIRDAAGRSLLNEPWALFPVFDTFMMALPNALREVDAPRRAIARLTITGAAGGCWQVRKTATEWEMCLADDSAPFARIVLDQDTAWRLYTKGIAREDAFCRIEQNGDAKATAAMIGMVTVLA